MNEETIIRKNRDYKSETTYQAKVQATTGAVTGMEKCSSYCGGRRC
jgi:hypothetical protein